MKSYFIIISLIFSLLQSCDSESNQNDFIPEEKFIEVMTDIYMVDAYVSYKIGIDFDQRDKNYGYYKSVLDKHKLTMTDFKKSYDFYKEDLNKFMHIHNSVLNKIISLKSN